MKIRIEIKTPPGQATGTEKKLRLFLLGRMDKPQETYVSPADDCFYWEVDVSIKRALDIQKNVGRFQNLTNWVLEQKMLKKAADKESDIKELQEMFKQTQVRIIKQATADEIVEANKTFWQRMKEKFKKTEAEE